jgi:hypothetical protein
MDRMALILGRDVAGIGQQGLNVACPEIERHALPRSVEGSTEGCDASSCGRTEKGELRDVSG